MSPKKKTKINGFLILFLGLFLILIGALFKAPMPAYQKILVATESVKGAELEKSVILVTRHTLFGATGFTLNKKDSGGLLEKENIYVLHSDDVSFLQSEKIKGSNISIAEGKEAEKALKSAKKKPRWSVVLRGYMGWGPRQLEKEIKAGHWKLIDYNEDIVVKTPPVKMWDRARKMPAIYP